MKFFNNGWDEVLEDEFEKPYFKELLEKVDEEYSKYKIYPPRGKIFAALTNCDINDIKVVILGQDPYHEEGQAHGLAFSVLNNVAPPSLKNIFKEIESDIGKSRKNPNLSDWAKQGVLLLNNTLTVKCHKANSHKKIGWQTFTDNVVKELNKKDNKIVFILWGNNAIEKEKIIDPKHIILKSVHPSPLSAYNGFFGSKVFSKTNQILKGLGYKEIKWED
jgi:uracil-DNA glycosylase